MDDLSAMMRSKIESAACWKMRPYVYRKPFRNPILSFHSIGGSRSQVNYASGDNCFWIIHFYGWA